MAQRKATLIDWVMLCVLGVWTVVTFVIFYGGREMVKRKGSHGGSRPGAGRKHSTRPDAGAVRKLRALGLTWPEVAGALQTSVRTAQRAVAGQFVQGNSAGNPNFGKAKP